MRKSTWRAVSRCLSTRIKTSSMSLLPQEWMSESYAEELIILSGTNTPTSLRSQSSSIPRSSTKSDRPFHTFRLRAHPRCGWIRTKEFWICLKSSSKLAKLQSTLSIMTTDHMQVFCRSCRLALGTETGSWILYGRGAIGSRYSMRCLRTLQLSRSVFFLTSTQGQTKAHRMSGVPRCLHGHHLASTRSRPLHRRPF